MAPQADLTAERAAKQYTMNDLFKLAMEGKVNIVEDRFVSAAALKTARQEALREARDYALACVAERNKQAFELTKTVLNDPRAVWLGCKASEAERIAEWIDRLASEGA